MGKMSAERRRGEKPAAYASNWREKTAKQDRRIRWGQSAAICALGLALVLSAGCGSPKASPIAEVDLPPPAPTRAVTVDEPTSRALTLLEDPSLPTETVVDLLQKLAKENPQSAGVKEALALAWERQGEDDEAIMGYRRVLELDGSRATSWLHLGILLKRNGRDLDGAIAALEKALETGAPRPRTLNELGVAYAYKGDLEKALGIWDRAIQEDPNWGVLYANALKGSLHLGREDLAQDYYEKGKDIEHPEENLAMQWGEYLAGKGDKKEARAVYDHAARQFPDSARIAYYHAQALLEVRDHDGAREEFHRAIRIDPEGPKGEVATWSNRALFIVDYPKEEKAFQGFIKDYFKAMEMPVEKQTKRMEELRPKVEALVENHPEFWNAWSLLAWIDRRLGDYHDAREALDRVLEIYPDEPNAVHEMGLLLREQGQLEEAHKYLLHASELAPRDPAVAMNLTLAEIDLGMWAEAQRRMDAIEEAYGRDAAEALRDYYKARREGKEPRPGERPEVPIGKFQ